MNLENEHEIRQQQIKKKFVCACMFYCTHTQQQDNKKLKQQQFQPRQQQRQNLTSIGNNCVEKRVEA